MDDRDLPTGWAKAQLSDVANIDVGNSPKGSTTNQNEEGIPVIVGASDIDGGKLSPAKHTTSPTKVCQEGDLIFCIRATIGKACVADREYCLGRGVAGIRPVASSRRWLKHLLDHKEQELASQGTGSTFDQISKGDLKNLEIALPPLPEQRRTADRLDAIQSHAQKARETLANAPGSIEEYRQSVLNAAFTGQLTVDWRADHPDVEPADELLERILEERRKQWEKDYRAKYEAKGKEPPSGWRSRYSEPDDFATNEDLFGIPKKWIWTNIDHLTISGPQNGLYLPKSRYGSGTPILRIDDYQIGWSRSADELQRVEAEDKDVKKYSLNVGDLVINRVNSVSHLGKCLLVEERNVPSLFESNMMRLRPTSLGSKQYITDFLQSVQGRFMLIRNAKHAVNQASINQGDVTGTPVPLPPEEEQKEIVRRVRQRLDKIDQMATHVEQARKRLDHLDRSVLAKAFRGELVETEAQRARREDRDYETAEELLARVSEDDATSDVAKASKQPSNGRQLEMDM